MRVIAGRARGRTLAGPPAGHATRPTSDKVRGALFNILADRIPDARVLDLFAGTGALGIEALSRGASHVTFVESDRALCAVIAKNLAATRLDASAHVICRDVRRVASAIRPHAPFDLVLLDPPYGFGLERAAVHLLVAEKLVAPGGLLVVEHTRREPLEFGDDAGALTEVGRREYGDTVLSWFAVRDPSGHADSEPSA